MLNNFFQKALHKSFPFSSLFKKKKKNLVAQKLLNNI